MTQTNPTKPGLSSGGAENMYDATGALKIKSLGGSAGPGLSGVNSKFLTNNR